MVIKDTVFRWILTLSGLLILILILLSKTSSIAKGIGALLGVLLIAFGVIMTGSLKKHFEETREGTMNPDQFR